MLCSIPEVFDGGGSGCEPGGAFQVFKLSAVADFFQGVVSIMSHADPCK